MRLYSLISIMHAQFGTPTSIKKSKQSYKLLKTNVYVSAFNQIIKPVGITEFKQINQVPVNYRFRQCLSLLNVFTFFDDKCPLYMKDFFDNPCMGQASTRNSLMKLSQPLRITNYGQHYISLSQLHQFGTTCRMN